MVFLKCISDTHLTASINDSAARALSQCDAVFKQNTLGHLVLADVHASSPCTPCTNPGHIAQYNLYISLFI